MAITNSLQKMLEESLPEMLEAARVCIGHKKKDGGCLGYPATLLLLSIVDTIGSYYHGNKDFYIKIDGKDKIINKSGYKHFYILNSHYFNLGLSEIMIKKIYDNYRSLLVHNGVIAKKHFITIHDPLGQPFSSDTLQDLETGEKYPCISLNPLYISCHYAVKDFLEKLNDIFPASIQAEIINKK